MSILEEALNSLGPCLTSELAQELVGRGLSAEAARQRISRRGPQIAILSNIVFPHKARFIYFKADFESEKYWQALESRLTENSPTYGSAIQSLLLRSGMMPLEHFLIACGSPFLQKGHVSASRILDNLLQARIITKFSDSKLGDCIKLKSIDGTEEYHGILNMRARIFVENILLDYIKQWMKNLSLSSYHKTAIRTDNDLPAVGTYHWDLTGPSYLYPLRKISKDKEVHPGFIVCDLLLRSEITEDGISPFIKKYVTLNSLKNINKSLYLIVADRFSAAALKVAKSKGIIPATPENLFGEEVAQSLDVLFSLLVRVTEKFNVPDAIDKIYELLTRLGKIEGAALNLRGALFPYLVTELFRSNGFSVEKFGHIIRNKNGEIVAEVDLVLKKGTKEIVYIECKGNDPGSSVSDKEVEKWLRKLPVWREDYLKHDEWNKLNFRVEFWATGHFSETARQILEYKKSNSNRNKWLIDYCDNDSIAQQAKEANNIALFNTLKEHFLRHPLN